MRFSWIPTVLVGACLIGMPFFVRADTLQPVVFDGEGIEIGLDGSPTAFNPHTDAGRKAIDANRETCCVLAPKDWHGAAASFDLPSALDRHQGPERDKFVVNLRTGTFVSSTSLQNPRFKKTDQLRYVDPETTPYISLSNDQAEACGCVLGDRVLLTESASRLSVWAVYANNAGPKTNGLAYTEISPAAATSLQIAFNPATHEPLATNYHITIRIFPHSGYGALFPRGKIPPVREAAKY